MIAESVTVRHGSYTITSIEPCTMEKGKKMAKVRFTNPPSDIFARLQNAGLEKLRTFPELGVATFRIRGKRIIVFSSGEISIRTAETEKDITETVERIARVLKQ